MIASQYKRGSHVNSQPDAKNKPRTAMKQIIIFGLLLVPMWTYGMKCYEDHELEAAAMRKLSSHYPQPVEHQAAAAPHSPVSCPVEYFPLHPPQQPHERSLSPWRYELVSIKDHFPSTYAKAKCLCSGCIMIQNNSRPTESHDYNSYPVIQKKCFSKKEPCTDGKKYYLKPVTVDVAVGCTCLRTNIYKGSNPDLRSH